MALVTIAEVKDVTTLLTMQIKGYRAWDKRTGVHLTCSRGRRMTGRPRRYYGIVPLEYEEIYQPAFRDPNQRSCTKQLRFGITAQNDEEARNKFLARLKREGGKRGRK